MYQIFFTPSAEKYVILFVYMYELSKYGRNLQNLKRIKHDDFIAF